MIDPKTHWYILTFRCVYCGRDLTAKGSFQGEALESQIRARIYEAKCESCGWKGEVCGASATRISEVKVAPNLG